LYAATLSADRRRYAFQSEDRVEVFDASDPARVAAIDNVLAFSLSKTLSLSRDGRRLAIDSYPATRVFEFEERGAPKLLMSTPPSVFAGRPPVALSPDGSLLFSIDTLFTVPAADVRCRTGQLGTVEWSPDGATLWTALGPAVRALSAADCQVRASVTVPGADIIALALSADQKSLVVGGSDGAWLVDLASGRSQRLLQGSIVRGLAISPDGEWMAAAGERVSLWRRGELAPVLSFPSQGEGFFVTFPPGGHELLHAGTQLDAVSLDDGTAGPGGQEGLDEVLRTYGLVMDGDTVLSAPPAD
jgi:WD40 repeat protein